MPVLQLNPKKTALVLIDLQNSALGVNTAPYAVVQVIGKSLPKPSAPPALQLSM